MQIEQPIRSLDEIATLRQAIVDEAASWVGTRYHSGARIKGVGADCCTFIAGVLINVGLIPEDTHIPFYRRDFMLHQQDEDYLRGLLDYGREIPEDEIGPGDVVLYRLRGAGIYCHTGFVVNWPQIIHCYMTGVQPTNGLHMGFGGRPRKFLTVFRAE